MRRSSSELFFLFCLFPFIYGEKLDFRLIYDSNPFLLSDSQIITFLKGKEMGFKTYDDLALRFSLQPFNFAIREWRILPSFTSQVYCQNPVKSFPSLTLTIKRFFGSLRRSGYLRGDFMPYYLIRPLRKEGGKIDYLSYSERSGEVGFSYEGKSAFFSIRFQNYPKDYDFYDLDIYSVGLRKQLGKISGEIEGGRALARGRKDEGELDISYWNLKLDLGVKFLIGRSLTSFTFSGERRSFTTTTDIKHKGRRDLIGKGEVSFSFPVKEKTSLYLGYECKIRRTTAEIDLSEIKDYERNKIYLGVRYE